MFFERVSHLWRFQVEHLQRLGRRRLAEVDGPRRAVGPEKLGQAGHVDIVVVVKVAPPAVSRTKKDRITLEAHSVHVEFGLSHTATQLGFHFREISYGAPL